MKKLLALFLVSVLFLLTMTGCHGAKRRDAFVIPEEWDETRQYEISFWAKSDTNVTQTRIYEKAIRDFEALYPNIKVNLKIYTDYGKTTYKRQYIRGQQNPSVISFLQFPLNQFL